MERSLEEFRQFRRQLNARITESGHLTTSSAALPRGSRARSCWTR